MDPGEENFTWSSFDFNSSFALYSSDDDEGHDYGNKQQLDQGSKDDIDTYIELELPSPPPPPPPPAAADDDDDDDDRELEIRISFSAVVPFPGFHPCSINSANIVSYKPFFNTSEDANAHEPTAVIDSSPQPAVESTISCIRRKPISNISAVSIFPVAWTRFPPPFVDDYAGDCSRVSDSNSWELVRSRKSSPNSATNDWITKLLVKLRSAITSSFGSMRSSLAQDGHPTQQRRPNRRRAASAKPFERWFALCKLSEPRQRMHAVRKNVVVGSSSDETRSSPSKIMEMIKFEAMKKLFGNGNGVNPFKNIGGKSSRVNKSCPTSIKSSPVHQSGDNTSILVHAAIAHCKKSFGQYDDFSF